MLHIQQKDYTGQDAAKLFNVRVSNPDKFFFQSSRSAYEPSCLGIDDVYVLFEKDAAHLDRAMELMCVVKDAVKYLWRQQPAMLDPGMVRQYKMYVEEMLNSLDAMHRELTAEEEA